MTRMWLVPAQWLCDKHLLGEHSEMHQAAGTIANHEHGEAVMEGHLNDDAPDDVETTLIVARHDELAEEMGRRGMDHDGGNALADFEDPGIGRLEAGDLHRNIADLLNRCAACRRNVAAEHSYLRESLLVHGELALGARPGWPDDAWAFRGEE